MSLEAPLGAIKNAAKRWATTINFDILIYSDRIVVARGFSYRDIGAHRDARRAATIEEVNASRAARSAALSESDLLNADPGNRVIPVADIASARLNKRLGICTLRLELQSGERTKFLWMNASKLATPLDDAREWLSQALGSKLRG